MLTKTSEGMSNMGPDGSGQKMATIRELLSGINWLASSAGTGSCTSVSYVTTGYTKDILVKKQSTKSTYFLLGTSTPHIGG